MKAVKDFSIEGNPAFLVQLFLNTGKVEKGFSNPHFMRLFFRTALLVFVQETASNQITQSVSLGRKGSREI
ncbi:hypothetical protein ECBG_04239 [Enterococcus casseliflavus EC20]|uniref:Uncharacterized protein n=1 Tax=Enterococcus casseliflavus EC20 TaxID=565655 RepID=M9T8B9_ENTCA|nr:hypothetical protein [Enterococcus casseliflavus]AGJ01192.1 hypothetical protein ECBG_04239 [Enterococcus casseliflavus EC20]